MTKGGTYQRVLKEGGGPVAKEGLGEMPLTLFVIVAGVVLYLHIRRANLGIDTHPGETVQTGKPTVPTVSIPYSQGGKPSAPPPVLEMPGSAPAGNLQDGLTGG